MAFTRTLVVVVSVAELMACTRTNAALMDNSVHLAPTCADAVKVYMSPDKIGAEYTEVALLNSTSATGWADESGMVESMRKKAASVGATGIIMRTVCSTVR
jgi:hypothetical protein